MTREKIINEIKPILDELNYPDAVSYLTQNDVKWLNEIIKKLEQEPCEDAVRRTEVIDELNRLGRNAFKDDTDYDNFFAFVDSLPSVTPQESKWIPVTEKLPNKDGEYLLFGKITEDEENYIFVGEYDSCGEQFGIWQEQFDRATLGCLGSEFFEYSSVLAWMPLPKPYKESEEV